jgi:hypothetical protein
MKRINPQIMFLSQYNKKENVLINVIIYYLLVSNYFDYIELERRLNLNLKGNGEEINNYTTLTTLTTTNQSTFFMN